MKRVYSAELEAGMVVARTVMGSDGRHFINENTELTVNLIKKLQELGIPSVFVKDYLTDMEADDIVSNKVLATVSSTLKHSLNTFCNGKGLEMTSLRKMVNLLIDEVILNRNTLIQKEEIHSHDDYLLFHPINVSIYAIMTGLSLGYPEGNIVDLGLGTLLHDIGMIAIDRSIINNPGTLNPQEMDIIKQHPEAGFNILRSYHELSTTSAHIAYQHHERVDGSGYPRGLRDKEIVEYAKITAVVDTFDAVISDHPYRKAYSTIDGLTVLKGLRNTYFDPEIVDAFISNIALYPIGSLIRLNDGRIAVVTSANRFNMTRPIIEVMTDQYGNPLKTSTSIDLQQSSKIKISGRLNKQETADILHKITRAREDNLPTDINAAGL
jgi:HD-GYP domain-containing protein (c-di-GMP phosphodiesterase class II)